MTPICQNVHEEDSAQLKDLGRPSDGRPLKHNESTQVFISEECPIPHTVDRFGSSSGQRTSKHNYGLQASISDS
mgnify:CR=1 FL=1